MATGSIPELFTVYYMNQQKVFETRMLLDNKLKTGGSQECQETTGGSAEADLEGGFDPPILTKLKAKVTGEAHHEKQEKIVDTLEFVNTKSRMLADIIQHCITPENGKTFTEGNLVYIGGVSLELINEEEIRGIMAIMSGTFDGIMVPDAGNLDIGRMLQSFIGDGAAFKLCGKRTGRNTPLYAKIPLDGEGMFESKYTIDDLLIGQVGIVGICKGKISPVELKSPLDYFQKPNKSKPAPAGVVECDEGIACPENSCHEPYAKKGYYIDVLAIIQAVSFNSE